MVIDQNKSTCFFMQQHLKKSGIWKICLLAQATYIEHVFREKVRRRVSLAINFYFLIYIYAIHGILQQFNLEKPRDTAITFVVKPNKSTSAHNIMYICPLSLSSDVSPPKKGGNMPASPLLWPYITYPCPYFPIPKVHSQLVAQ